MKTFTQFLLKCGCISILMALNMSAAQAANINSIKFGQTYILKIDGKIEKGDFSKFMRELSKLFKLSTIKYQENLKKAKKENSVAYKDWNDKYGEPKGIARINVSLNSMGGDVVEAIKISKAIRDMLLSTETGFVSRNNEFQDTRCMSACFFIWAAGIERDATFRNGKNPLGIHRLYFDQDYYKGLSSKEAEVEYKKLKSLAKLSLQEMGIPDDYFSKMFNIPSNDVYLLSKQEVNNLEGKSPYFEELLFSKCGSYTKQEDQDYDDCLITMPGIRDGAYENIFIPNRSKIVIKCSTASPGYLEYVKTKHNEINRCWNVYTAIERWERMSKYFGKKDSG